MAADELVNEIQRTIKALLGIGARLPKELMLFIKNMVFLDGAIATLAPDLDIIGEIGQRVDALRHHARRAAGRRARDGPERRYELDLTGMKASFGYEPGEGAHLPRAAGAARDHPRPPPEASRQRR